MAEGYFARQAQPETLDALYAAAAALGVTRRIELPEPGVARAAAMIITAVEGSELHLSDLKARSADFDPKTRARFQAGALIPAAWYAHAQRFRRWYTAALAELFRNVDVILAPATPYPAFPIGQVFAQIDGMQLPAAGHLGVFTQPISFAGLPVVAAPVTTAGALPIGMQIIAAPWREDLALRVAHAGELAQVFGIASPPFLSMSS